MSFLMLLSHLSEFHVMWNWNSRHNRQKRCDWSGKINTLWTLAKCFMILANLFYKCLGMLANVVGKLTNVLWSKPECKTWVSNLHIKIHITGVSLCLLSASPCPISLFSFKLGLIVHIRPAFCRNVNANAGESLQTYYDHLQKSQDPRMLTNTTRMLTNFLRSLRIGAELNS